MENAALYHSNKEVKAKATNLSKSPKNTHRAKAIFPPFIEEFGRFLKDSNYSFPTIESYKIKVRRIIKDCEEDISDIKYVNLSDFKNITNDFKLRIENYIFIRIERKELTPASAHVYMKAFKAFMQFLFFREIVTYKYNIPNYLLSTNKRANLYVEQIDIIELAESIRNNINPVRKARSYALLLLYIETGCRPIEASNILVSDINFTEKTIRLYSVKSGTRRLTLDSYVLKAFKQYMTIRETLSPRSDYFFIKNNGERTNTKYLTTQLAYENSDAFGYQKVNARALRHTYVTNAFENKNAFKDVSETVGHKHWVSTLHYLHRSKERLLSNTLPFNPMANILKSEVSNNAN